MNKPINPDTELDPVVVEVCRLIRLDRFDLADSLWEQERANRRSDDTLADHTLVVARTFVDQAEQIQRGEPAQARAAAARAYAWARHAAAGLEDPEQTDVQDVQARAKQVARETAAAN